MKKRSFSTSIMLSSLLALLITSCTNTNQNKPTSSESQSSSEEKQSSSVVESSSSQSETSSISESSPEESSTVVESSSDSSPEESSPEESSSVVPDPVKIDDPVIMVNEDSTGLDFTCEHGTLQVKVNDGEFQEASSVLFAEDAGNYTVTVKAVGDGEEYSDSDEVTFAYQTIKSDLTVTKTSATTATVSGTGLKVTANGVDFTGTTYEASESEVVTFEAVGGFDATNKIYYSESVEESVSFKVLAGDPSVLEDADGKEAADLADEWTIKKYSNGWIDTSATLSVAKGRNDSDALVLNAWNNSTVFRYSKNYSVNEGYNAISFDLKGDDIVTLKIQLMSSDSGVYTTYNLGTISSCWANYKISMDDENWKINVGGTDYKLSDVINYVGAADTSEIIPYFDQFNIIISGNTPNGATTKVYFDNIKFESDVVSTNAAFYIDNVPAAYVGKSNGINFTISDTKITTLNLTQVDTTKESEMEVPVASVTKELNKVTYRFTGIDDTLTCTYKNDGASMVVSNITGNVLSQAIVTGTQFAKKGELNLDFEDGTVGSAYVNENWTQYMYGNSGWESQTGKMNSRKNPSQTSKVTNFYTGSSMSYLYKYNEFGDSIGLVDYVSIDLGNYFSGATAIKVKFSVVDTAGTVHYLLGGSDWNQYAVTTDLVTNEFYLDSPIDVKFVQICVNSSANNAYLYADNLVLDFKGRAKEEEPPVTPPEGPETVETELLDLDFQNLTTQTDFTSTDWTKQKYTASGWTDITSTCMRVRTSPAGSIVVNMAAGYSTPYMYAYVPSAALEGVNKLSIDLGNYFTGAQAMNVKVFALDTNGNKHYVLGGDSEWYSLAVTTDLETFSKEFETAFDLAKFVIVNNSSINGNAFLYMDNVKAIKVEEKNDEPQKANLTLDFQSLTSGSDYTGSDWTKQKYTASGWASGGAMRIRTSPVGQSIVLNMTAGYSTPYMYTYTPASEVGLTNKVSIDLGNYWTGAQEMNVKVIALDKDGGKHYVLGGDSDWYTLAVSTDLDTYAKEFEEEFEFAGLVVVNQSAKNGDTFLYMDNIKVTYEEAE